MLRMPDEPPRRSLRIADLRGAVRLAVDGVTGATHIAQGLHGSIVNLAPPLGAVRVPPVRGIAGLVYGAVRTTSGLVGGALDRALAGMQALLPAGTDDASSPARDAWLAALNGVVGDHLERTGNPLATRMALLPADAAGAHWVVLLHGLCMNEQQWARGGHDHGAALAADLGCTPLYLRYNSGRHVSANGADFAQLLEERVAASPVRVERIDFIGHSMGGLVARSALQAAQAGGMAWPRLLRTMVFLGTPHHGAALERGGNWVDSVFRLSPYLAPFLRLGAIRSDGITDLRYGNLLPGDWAGGRHGRRDTRTPVPLPHGVDCYAIAGMLGVQGAQPLLGDGLVSVDSAFGRHARPTKDLKLPSSHTWVAKGVGHLGLLESRGVYKHMRDWLSAAPNPDTPASDTSSSPARPA
jgi:pimeloyl-ACP methyl ester carboxylesterase